MGKSVFYNSGNEASQIDAFDHKLVDNVNHVLRQADVASCDIEQIYHLKRSIGVLLIDMIEENSSSGHIKMIVDAINKDDINQSIIDAYDFLQTDDRAIDHPQVEDLVINVGFTFHHLLNRAFDVDESIDRSRFTDSPAWEYFAAHTMSIELQKGTSLQRVYFTVQDKDVLRQSVKQRVKWEVDRSSPTNKLRDFMTWAKEVCEDIRYQRRVQSVPVARWLVKKWALLNTSVLVITFMLNLLVLFGWIAPEKYNSDYEYDVLSGHYMPFISDEVYLALLVLGVIHIFLWLMICVSFLLSNRPNLPPHLIRFWRWLRSLRSTKLERKRQREKPLPEPNLLGVDLISWNGIYYPLMLLLSVLGTLSYGEFFCFHMLHIVRQNQLLARVMLAVTLNGRSMLWVVFLGIIFFYIYGILGFLLLRNVFLGNQLYCHNLFECVVATIRNGLMFGMGD
uniref:Ion transport domain-containing protein n=1 Tax=Plectus sambesii TaxID=2011161 RepID=A0A914VIM6_9BILA